MMLAGNIQSDSSTVAISSLLDEQLDGDDRSSSCGAIHLLYILLAVGVKAIFWRITFKQQQQTKI